ncbi:MAG: ABC transporter permease [Methylococcaceae bacterium]|nr:ABC transporter permease [Methylococcaceae bacterium]
MRAADVMILASQSITSQRLRSALILIAMSIGVAAVIILTALGESARHAITGKFTALGTNLLIILPGRSETTGGQPPLLGETPRDLTLDDALALLRSPYIAKIAPIAIGAAPVSGQQREREANIMGSTADLLDVRHLNLAQGLFLPKIPPQSALSVCVIGQTIRSELFGSGPVLGRWLRIGDRRFRVIGVLAPEGESIGVDFDETVIIPVASAQVLFDSPSLFRVLVEAKSRSATHSASKDINGIIEARHEGENDVTVISQDSVVNTFDKILTKLTLCIAGIAAISLVVAGILIMNVMLVSVAQRSAEIGLLKAIGAGCVQLNILFLAEAALLSLTGAVAGLISGYAGALLIGIFYPAFPVTIPALAPFAALAMALLTGLLFGVLPAARAANLNPVEALAKR